MLTRFLGELKQFNTRKLICQVLFQTFSSFFLGIFHCVPSCDSLIILSLPFRFVKPFSDIFFVLEFNCTTHKQELVVLCIFNNNRFTSLKKQSVLPPCSMFFMFYLPYTAAIILVRSIASSIPHPSAILPESICSRGSGISGSISTFFSS